MELKFKVTCRLAYFKVNNWDFLQIGVEFEETTPDGRDVTAICTLDNGKLVTVQTAKKSGQKSTR